MPKLDHIAIEVSDMDASIEFYKNILGFSFVSRAIDQKENEEYCYLESEGFFLELLKDNEKKLKIDKKVNRPYTPHVCFKTDDMEKTIDELKSNDIEIVHGPLIIEGEATWIYYVDPDNNVLEYIQRF